MTELFHTAGGKPFRLADLLPSIVSEIEKYRPVQVGVVTFFVHPETVSTEEFGVFHPAVTETVFKLARHMAGLKLSVKEGKELIKLINKVVDNERTMICDRIYLIMD